MSNWRGIIVNQQLKRQQSLECHLYVSDINVRLSQFTTEAKLPVPAAPRGRTDCVLTGDPTQTRELGVMSAQLNMHSWPRGLSQRCDSRQKGANEDNTNPMCRDLKNPAKEIPDIYKV